MFIQKFGFSSIDVGWLSGWLVAMVCSVPSVIISVCVHTGTDVFCAVPKLDVLGDCTALHWECVFLNDVVA